MIIELFFIYCIINYHWGIWVLLGASDVQLELDAVFFSVAGCGINGFSQITLIQAYVVLEVPRVSLDRDQTYSVS